MRKIKFDNGITIRRGGNSSFLAPAVALVTLATGGYVLSEVTRKEADYKGRANWVEKVHDQIPAHEKNANSFIR